MDFINLIGFVCVCLGGGEENKHRKANKNMFILHQNATEYSSQVYTLRRRALQVNSFVARSTRLGLDISKSSPTTCIERYYKLPTAK